MLTKAKQKKLEELAESKKAVGALIRYFDAKRIDRELKVINEKIAALKKEKEKIIEKRLKPSTQQTVELEQRLVKIAKEEKGVKQNPGLLEKLKKALARVNELEAKIALEK